MKDVALVTHRGCLDGSACALVFLACGGKRENIYFSSPSHEHSDELVEDLAANWPGNIVLADISISFKLAEKLDKSNGNIYVLDHHKSALPLEKFAWCEIDKNNSRCGSLMLYDFCSLNYRTKDLINYLDLVGLADDHDRWIHADKNSEKMSTFHNILGQDLFIERFSKHASVFLNEKEKYLLEIEEKNKQSYVESKIKEATFYYREIDGKEVKLAVVKADNHQSRLGNDLCHKTNSDISVMIGLNSVSLRARQDCPVDLSKVAKLNGGGGHYSASGFSTNGLLGEDLMEHLYSKIRWEQ